MARHDWRRFAAVDVHYPRDGGACAALVVAADARFATIVEEHVVELMDVESYQSGRFFTRELPAIQAVTAYALDLDVLIVDGYVDLDPEGRPGLGSHVHTHLDMPVIGVAKTPFRTATHAVAVRRGTATRPLLGALLTTCNAAGVRQVVAVIADTGSDASAALHRRLGFTDAGRLVGVGRKHGRWVDTLRMQRDLTATATCGPPGSPGA